MRRRVRAVVWLLLGGLAAAAPAWADGDAGGAAPYLRAGLGARALGMGNAQTAAVADATAAYWDPAALVALDGSGAASQLAVLGDGRSSQFLNFCQSARLGQAGRCGFGLSWVHFSAGEDLEARVGNTPEQDSVFADSQHAFLVSAASDFGSAVSLGVNVKLLTHTLAGETALGSGVDVALWQSGDGWSWGVCVADAYSALTWPDGYSDRLPTVTRAGIAWDLVPRTLTLAADGSLEWTHVGERVAELGYHLGAEYRPFAPLAVRAGLDQGRWAAGLGLAIDLSERVKMELDYAVTAEQLPGAGPTHLFSLNFAFPARNART